MMPAEMTKSPYDSFLRAYFCQEEAHGHAEAFMLTMILLGRCYFIHLPIEEAKVPRDCVTRHRHTVGSVAMQAGVGINA